MQVRPPSVAEMVADTLRERILRSDDGAALPSQEKLIEEFGVGKPSLREALRILETEGLISVQRGNVGGAVMHRPDADQAAYTLALVLQSRDVQLADVGRALQELHPSCASLCALRADRAETVVPRLRASNDRAAAAVDDREQFALAMTEFHDLLIDGCGNESLKLVAGAIVALWHAHIRVWATEAGDSGRFPQTAERRTGLRDHERIADLIERGDAVAVAKLMRGHFDPMTSLPSSDDETTRVVATTVRPPGAGRRRRP